MSVSKRSILIAAAAVVALVVLVLLVHHGVIAARHVISVVVCLVVYGAIFKTFLLLNSGTSYYFDPQDFVKYEAGGGRELPVSAATGTFEPLLPHYIGVSKLLITVAAASITFGVNQSEKGGISTAKLILAFSILYGVLFCAAVLYLYDEYSQNVRVYSRFWYSTVESLGFSCLVCFFLGYVVWALTT